MVGGGEQGRGGVGLADALKIKTFCLKIRTFCFYSKMIKIYKKIKNKIKIKTFCPGITHTSEKQF